MAMHMFMSWELSRSFANLRTRRSDVQGHLQGNPVGAWCVEEGTQPEIKSHFATALDAWARAKKKKFDGPGRVMLVGEVTQASCPIFGRVILAPEGTEQVMRSVTDA